MSNNIPDKIKTGFNLVTDEDTENLTEEEKNYLRSMLITIVSNALYKASVYVDHSGRQSILPEDMKMGLMMECKKFTELPECNNGDNDTDDTDTDDDTTSNTDVQTLAEVWCESTCECNTCTTLNEIKNSWDTWTPQNKIQEIIRDGINKI